MYIYTESSWSQVAKVIPNTPADGAEFGDSVALQGDTLVVGAPFDGTSNAGRAYVFYRDGSTWDQVAILAASDSDDGWFFGTSVAIDGNNIVVGAQGAGDPAGSGQAYIFEREDAESEDWDEMAILAPSSNSVTTFDRFGFSVAISGDYAIVGSPESDENGTDSGTAYIFERDHETADEWGEVAFLEGDEDAGDRFGHAVTMDGATVAVGARDDDVDEHTAAGAVYIYYNSGGTWSETVEERITTGDGADGSDQLGTSVSLSGDTLVVGAPGDDDDGAEAGAMYVYYRNLDAADDWGEAAKLTGTDTTGGDLFGTSVSIDGDLSTTGVLEDSRTYPKTPDRADMIAC